MQEYTSFCNITVVIFQQVLLGFFIIFIIFYLLFLFVHALAYVYLPCVCIDSPNSEKGLFPETIGTDSQELLCGCWPLNLGPLHSQKAGSTFNYWAFSPPRLILVSSMGKVTYRPWFHWLQISVNSLGEKNVACLNPTALGSGSSSPFPSHPLSPQHLPSPSPFSLCFLYFWLWA